MLHSLDITSAKALLKELKPLIILYLEDYDDKDPVTKKPKVKQTNLLNLYRMVLQYGITQAEWEGLLSEFENISIVLTAQIRRHLHSIKEQKDNKWNIYWNKVKILQTIRDILDKKSGETLQK